MPVAQVPRSLEVVPGMLHALGGVAAVDGRISWFAGSARGYAPLLCYLLTGDGGDVLVDTNMPVFQESVLDRLGALHANGTPLTVTLSRNPEFDSIGNAGVVLTRFPTQRLISIFEAEPWLYFRPESGALPPSRRPAEMVPEWVEIRRDMAIPVGAGRELLVTPAPLRLLSTFWYWDEATGTLFTSDAFGHTLMEREDDPWYVDADTDVITYEQVRDHLLAKFDWLADARTGPIRAQLAEIFAERDVRIVAPQFGRVIRGRETVARHRDLVLAALEEVGVEN